MVANHRNWQQLGIMLTERLQEFGYTNYQLKELAGFPSHTYTTSLLSGRARLKLEYVSPLAEALLLDEDDLFRTALEGRVEAHELADFRRLFDHWTLRKGKKQK